MVYVGRLYLVRSAAFGEAALLMRYGRVIKAAPPLRELLGYTLPEVREACAASGWRLNTARGLSPDDRKIIEASPTEKAAPTLPLSEDDLVYSQTVELKHARLYWAQMYSEQKERMREPEAEVEQLRKRQVQAEPKRLK